MKNVILLLAVLFVAPRGHAVHAAEGSRRSTDIAAVLRLQDMRAPFGAPMAAFLRSVDPAVRRRAALACGSLQDTAALGALLAAVTDSDTAVAEAAAFAVGQTAGRLPAAERGRLCDGLITHTLAAARDGGRLTEEIGKFAAPSELAELVARAGERDTVHTAMAVARCAIRGVTAPAATTYLLGLLRGRGPVPWQVAYALQRIGDVPETRENVPAVLSMAVSGDPLVRMNLAALLGKLHAGDACLNALVSLASRDADWRVRVNAIRALALFPAGGRPDVVPVFARAFRDRSFNVALAALAAFPPQGFVEGTQGPSARALALLREMAANVGGRYAWQLQGEAASALSRIEKSASPLRAAGARGGRPELRAMLLRAAGTTGDTAAEQFLCSAARSSDPRIACAALDGLGEAARRAAARRSECDSVVSLSLRALGSGDPAIVATAAGLLGDSLFRRSSSEGPLLGALKGLRDPGDIEAIQDVLGALRSVTGRDCAADAPAMPERSPAAADSALRGWTGKEIRVTLATSRGDILIALDSDGAPFTVTSMLRLSRAGFYRRLTFHRVVPNFVVQGGDPRGDGWGGPPYTLRSEFSTARYGRGTVGIASAGKDTEGSQFFITHSPQPHLDGRYTVVGRVLKGMAVVDALRVGDRIIDIRPAP